MALYRWIACFAFVTSILVSGGCAEPSTTPEDDGGATADAGTRVDASRDASTVVDANRADADRVDADAGVGDAATSDADISGDAGPPSDGGDFDAATGDAGEPDDAGPVDANVDLPDVMVADAHVPSCGVGARFCDGACHLDDDSEHCGGCGLSCYADGVVGAACESGTCRITACTPGFGDVNGVETDGCEAEQSFAIHLDSSTLVLPQGGFTTIGIDVERINGFPFSVSANVLDGPLSITVTPSNLTTAPRLTVGLAASPTALSGRFVTRVVVSGGFGPAFEQHELPLTIDVLVSPVRITSVEVVRGSTILPGNQAPQSSGTVRLRVRGTNLLAVASAALTDLGLADVPGATDTQREWSTEVPSGFDVGEAQGQRALTLELRGPGAVPIATYPSALIATAISVSPTGNDASGVGTVASPLATLDRAWTLARADDTVMLLAGTHRPALAALTVAIKELRGVTATDSIVDCGSDRTYGLDSARRTNLRNLTIEDCDFGVRVADGSGGVDVTDVVLRNCDEPIQVASPSLVRLRRTTVTESGPLTFVGGGANVRDSAIDSGIRAEGTLLTVIDSVISAATGNGIDVAASAGVSRIEGSTIEAPAGDGIHLSPGAEVEAIGVVVRYSARGVVVDGAELVAEGFSALGNDGHGILLVGASPVATFNAVPCVSSQNGGMGMAVMPASGTVTLALNAMTLEHNVGGGLDIQNPTGVTTYASMGNAAFRDHDTFGMRVQGGTTVVNPGSRVDLVVSSPTARGIWLLSGGGRIDLNAGTWNVPRGTGFEIAGDARHSVGIGTSSTRSVTINLTGHPFDGTFGVRDDRGGTSLPTTGVRAIFIGSDGAPRTWSGTFGATTGSYSSSVSPRDLASWLVAHAGRIDFGAP